MDLETAIDNCQGAIRNNATISAIVATDAAESERSVVFGFSPELSRTILNAVLAALQGLHDQ